MKNLNLIRKIAWDFNRSTSLEFEELFGEASLAYVIAMQSYNPNKKTKLTTWATKIMKQHLINFCKKQQYEKNIFTSWNENLHPIYKNRYEQKMAVEEWQAVLSPDLQTICTILLTDKTINSKTPKATRGKIVNKLRKEKEWTWERIWTNFRNMKIAINQI